MNIGKYIQGKITQTILLSLISYAIIYTVLFGVDLVSSKLYVLTGVIILNITFIRTTLLKQLSKKNVFLTGAVISLVYNTMVMSYLGNISWAIVLMAATQQGIITLIIGMVRGIVK